MTEVYELGLISFTVDSSDAEFQAGLPKLLRRGRADSDKIHNLSADDFRSLLSKILELHPGYLWISAACIVSPQGHKVLIAGESSTGKSTTVLSMALRYGWKVLAEDLTCIDTRKNKIVVFATPFSLKTGTLELLQESIDMQPEPLVFGEWVPLTNMHADGEYDAAFRLALYFESARKGERFSSTACSSGRYVRLLLPCSNLVHDSSAPDKLAEYLKTAQCFHVQGGTLSERIELLLQTTTGDARSLLQSCLTQTGLAE